MEKIMSAEEKIKRAEEIYNRRREKQIKSNTAKVNVSNKKDIRLFKKMFIQILVCLSIYSIFYIVKNNNYIFSEDMLNKTKEILNYDVNFSELYYSIIERLKNYGILPQEESNKETTEDLEENAENNVDENNIGGAGENTQDISGLTQMEQDAINIKNSINFINPIEGTITSTFGWRNPTTSTVPKYHTGLDIANVEGTPIHSATEGEVVLASDKGEYRKSLEDTER